MIYIASDHGGFKLKKYLVEKLTSCGTEIDDLGSKELIPGDDYVDYAVLVSKKIQENPNDKGILICRNGVGMCISANRFKGVRAILSWNPKHSSSSKKHDDPNILCLPADFICKHVALKTVKKWLETPFENVERRVRRLQKVESI